MTSRSKESQDFEDEVLPVLLEQYEQKLREYFQETTLPDLLEQHEERLREEEDAEA